MKYIIIGLGNFGSTLASTLYDTGHEVIGVDSKEERTNSLKDYLTYVICLDATQREGLESLPLDTADAVVVSIGKQTGQSIMTAALLKQLGVERIICRATSALHKTVLETMGIKEIVFPEKQAAQRLASKLEYEDVIESFSLGEKYRIAEIDCPESFVGNSLAELSIPKDHNLLVLTIMRKKEKTNLLGISRSVNESLGIIKPDMTLQKDDILVVFGNQDDIRTFVKEIE